MSATIFVNVSVPHGHGSQLEGEAAPARACARNAHFRFASNFTFRFNQTSTSLCQNGA